MSTTAGIMPIAYFGPVCVDPADGERLHGFIKWEFEHGNPVRLNFEGVTTLTANFLVAAIGRLYGEFPVSLVDTWLTCVGLDRIDTDLVHVVRSNAKQFYAMTPEQQESILRWEAEVIDAI